MSRCDVFISYAHLDNQPLVAGQSGWITVFREMLQIRLSQLMGRVVDVWWDQRRLGGSEIFDAVIREACGSARVMVSVVTPRYVCSESCRQEVECFAHRGVRLGTQTRLMLAEKTPLAIEERAQAPGPLQQAQRETLGYRFFSQQERGGTFREYDAAGAEFADRLEDLAQDIRKLVPLVQDAPTLPPDALAAGEFSGDAAAAPGDAGFGDSGSAGTTSVGTTFQTDAAPCVFLATTAGDMREVRDHVRRELLARGIRVEPKVEWSENAEALRAEATESIAKGCLAVHIFGEHYGSIPEGGDCCYAEMQYTLATELAAARPKEAPLARLIWIPRGATANGERQAALLDRLRNDARCSEADEILEGTEELLKERIVAKLESIREQRAEQERLRRDLRRASNGDGHSAQEAVRKIYVISAEVDHEAALPVEALLRDKDLEVWSSAEITAEAASEADREAHHQEYLRQCNACLIYHGQTKLRWVRAQLDAARKALAMQSHPEKVSGAVYVAPPVDALKGRYSVVQFLRINGGLGSLQEELAPFLNQLSAGAAE